MTATPMPCHATLCWMQASLLAVWLDRTDGWIIGRMGVLIQDCHVGL